MNDHNLAKSPESQYCSSSGNSNEATYTVTPDVLELAVLNGMDLRLLNDCAGVAKLILDLLRSLRSLRSIFVEFIDQLSRIYRSIEIIEKSLKSS